MVTPLLSKCVDALGHVQSRLFGVTDAAGVAVWRICFGAVMLWYVVRSCSSTYLYIYYIAPRFHPKYEAFSWVHLPPYLVEPFFWALGLLALCILLGLFYRVTSLLFFLGFTYLFLVDRSYYTNHHYLICLLALIMALVPAHRAFSLDRYTSPRRRSQLVPVWSVVLLRFQVGVVYFYGGLAKLDADWLSGLPMSQFLRKVPELPVLGELHTQYWMALAFAYGGLIFDLCIVPLLLIPATRAVACLAAVAFHGINSQLFEIGIFPWLALGATTLFFAPHWPRRFIFRLGRSASSTSLHSHKLRIRPSLVAALGIYCFLQLVIPLRHYWYAGLPSWTGDGQNFSWRMMLVNKRVQGRLFYVDTPSRSYQEVSPNEDLSPPQFGRILKSPACILQYAHFLAERSRNAGSPIEIRSLIVVSLNGRPWQLLVHPTKDLAATAPNAWAADWVLPWRAPELLSRRMQLRTGSSSDDATLLGLQGFRRTANNEDHARTSDNSAMGLDPRLFQKALPE